MSKQKTLEHKIKFIALVPLVTEIRIKRDLEKDSLINKCESKIYDKCIARIKRIFKNQAIISRK